MSDFCGHAGPSLDLVTASLNFTTALTGLPAAPIVIATAQLVKRLRQWCEHERVNMDALAEVLRHTFDMAHPNTATMQHVMSLGSTASRLYGFHFVIPGSLARTILGDEHQTGLATTIAALLLHHSMNTVEKVLCGYIMRQASITIPAARFLFEQRIEPVVRQIVSSVAFNVSNLPQGQFGPTEHLGGLVKHCGSPHDLARAIEAVWQSAGQHLVVRGDHYPADLFEWLVRHWHGDIEVSLDGCIVWKGTARGRDQQAGQRTPTLCLVLAEPACPCVVQGDGYCRVQHQPLTICVAVTDSVVGQGQASPEGLVIWEATTTGAGNPEAYGGSRVRLYDVRNFADDYTIGSLLMPGDKQAARQIAQILVRDLLYTHFQVDEFSLCLQVAKNGGRPLADFLLATPALLQFDCGPLPDARPLHLQTDKHEEERFFIGRLTSMIPELAALLREMQKRCRCGCSLQPPPSYVLRQTRGGCLQQVMLIEVLLTVAHALAEAAGLDDISQIRRGTSGKHLLTSVSALLWDLIGPGYLRWNTWLAFAASASTGTQLDLGQDFEFKTVSEFKTVPATNSACLEPTRIFYVMGSITVAPAWLTLNQPIERASWGVQHLVGVPSGITLERAVVVASLGNTAATHISEEEKTVTRRTASPPPHPGLEMQYWPREREQDIHLLATVLSQEGHTYWYMNLCQTSKSHSIVDLAGIYLNRLRAVEVPDCAHPKGRLSEDECIPWILDGAFTSWHNRQQASHVRGATSQEPTPGPVHLAVTRSRLSHNLALGLRCPGRETHVLSAARGCWSCFLGAVEEVIGMGVLDERHA